MGRFVVLGLSSGICGCELRTRSFFGNSGVGILCWVYFRGPVGGIFVLGFLRELVCMICVLD